MRRVLSAVTLASIFATGCGVAATAQAPPGSRTASSAAVAVRAPCAVADATPLDAPRPETGPRLPSDFTPVIAYLCSEQQRPYPDDGVWVVLVGQRLDGDLGPLRSALLLPDTAEPSAPPGVTEACAASLVIRPTLVVVSASGQRLLPRGPVDWCGDQLVEVDDAIDGLRHVTVQTTKVRQVQSQESVAAAAKATSLGCEAAWKDPFSHGMVPQTLSQGGPYSPASGRVSLCLYRATAADPLTVGFVAGRRLSAAQTKQLLDAATLPGKRGGCSKPHAGVLVVSQGAMTPAEIELGGCSRVVRETQGRSSVGRVDAGIISGLVPR